MDASTTPAAAPTKEQYNDHVFSTLYVPAFLDKVAAVSGFQPRDEADVDKLLGMARTLAAQEEAETVKQAAAGSSFLDQAVTALNQVVGQPQQPAAPAWLKQAAADLAQRPDYQAAFDALTAAA